MSGQFGRLARGDRRTSAGMSYWDVAPTVKQNFGSEFWINFDLCNRAEQLIEGREADRPDYAAGAG